MKLHHILQAYPLFLVVLLSFLIVLCNTFTAYRLWFKYFLPQTDQLRGITTDSIVNLCFTAGLFVYLLVSGRRLKEVSMIAFGMQEIVNFLCDNSLRREHLRYNFQEQEFIVDTHSYPTDDILTIKATPPEAVFCDARRKIFKNEKINVTFLNLVTNKEVVRTLTVSESAYIRYSINVSITDNNDLGDPITFRPISFKLIKRTVWESVAYALTYLVDVKGVRSAIVTVMTLFLLDTVGSSIDDFVSPKTSPSVIVSTLTFMATNVLASIPVNALRFKWAYSNNNTIDDSFIALVFLLLTAVYLRSHRQDQDEAVFRKTSKTTIALLGLTLAAVYSTLDLPPLCYYNILELQIPIELLVTFVISATILVFFYLYVFYSQISLLKNKFRLSRNNIQQGRR